MAFGLLPDQVLTLRSGGGLCPDWEPGESFVLDMLGITPEQIVGFVSGDD
jgi:hypothetical protein